MLKLKRLISLFISFIDLCIKPFNVYYLNIEKLTKGCDTNLDLGCGRNSILGRIKNKKKCAVGVDIFEENLKISKKRNYSYRKN